MSCTEPHWQCHQCQACCNQTIASTMSITGDHSCMHVLLHIRMPQLPPMRVSAPTSWHYTLLLSPSRHYDCMQDAALSSSPGLPAVYWPSRQSCSSTGGIQRSTLHFSSRMSSGWLLTGHSMAISASSCKAGRRQVQQAGPLAHVQGIQQTCQRMQHRPATCCKFHKVRGAASAVVWRCIAFTPRAVAQAHAVLPKNARGHNHVAVHLSSGRDSEPLLQVRSTRKGKRQPCQVLCLYTVSACWHQLQR